jgi:oligopeptide/dipeptide ABC transporter ATP-binding protein
MSSEIVPSDYALEVRNLSTAFPHDTGKMAVVDDVSLTVRPGETLAVVGESGSGKTMTFLSVLGLVPAPGKIVNGEVLFAGKDLTTLSADQLREHRGAGIAMIFQDPLTALNPVFTIGAQIIEVIRAHRRVSAREARQQAIDLLERVQIPDPTRLIDNYPHQLSGGMRQRTLIAMAIAHNPKLLIADEPTTALDVTVQAQILELLAELRTEFDMGMVLITHDLGLVAKYADRMAVMYAGRVVEYCGINQGFAESRHPYTHSLLRGIPRLDTSPGEALKAIEGQPPNMATLPSGCAFRPRCFLGSERADCAEGRPDLQTTDDAGHFSACYHWRELSQGESD